MRLVYNEEVSEAPSPVSTSEASPSPLLRCLAQCPNSPSRFSLSNLIPSRLVPFHVNQIAKFHTCILLFLSSSLSVFHTFRRLVCGNNCLFIVYRTVLCILHAVAPTQFLFWSSLRLVLKCFFIVAWSM